MLKEYTPQIITVLAILIPLIPAFVLKQISDGNIMKTFENIKELGSQIGLKDNQFNNSIAKVNGIASFMNQNIMKFETKHKSKEFFLGILMITVFLVLPIWVSALYF
jgi:hypothetical protein